MPDAADLVSDNMHLILGFPYHEHRILTIRFLDSKAFTEALHRKWYLGIRPLRTKFMYYSYALALHVL